MRMRIWPHTACIQPLARTAGWPLCAGTEAQWQALCEVIQQPDLGHDSRFTTLAARSRTVRLWTRSWWPGRRRTVRRRLK